MTENSIWRILRLGEMENLQTLLDMDPDILLEKNDEVT